MATLPNWPTIQSGNTGANVYALQAMLNYRNNNTALVLDGSFGTGTYNAVLAYQKTNSLSVQNGVAESVTLSKLVSGVVVQQGSYNNAARAAQYLLNKFGAGLVIDGDFGPGSNTATKNFQTKMGITSDGVIGVTSWQYLFGYATYPTTTSTLAISGSMNIPNPYTQGNGLDVTGKVASNYNITNVTAKLLNSSSAAVYTGTATPNSTSYEMSGMNYALMFSKLTAGSYTYNVTASDSSNTSKTLVNTAFTVTGSGTQTPSYITLNGWLRLYTSPTSSKAGRDVSMPTVSGFTDSKGNTYTFTNKNYWWAYENPYGSSSNFINPYAYNRIKTLTGKVPVVNKGSKGEYTDENGNYWMAVGPNVVNPSHQSNTDITDVEMYGKGKLDVVVKDASGVKYYIPAVVGDAKAHTWSNGIIQTYKSFPNGTLALAGANFNGLVCAEFIGALANQFTGFGNYSIDKIIFYAN